MTNRVCQANVPTPPMPYAKANLQCNKMTPLVNFSVHILLILTSYGFKVDEYHSVLLSLKSGRGTVLLFLPKVEKDIFLCSDNVDVSSAYSSPVTNLREKAFLS